MSDQPQTRITATEFKQLSETAQPTELIHGEVIVSPSPISDHQRIVRRLLRLLETHMPNGEVMVSPMDVYLDEQNVFQPDLFWLARNSQCAERDGYFYGAPELVIEVLSPATSTRDKREKFDVYEQNGVIEYWIVDPAGTHIEVWQRAVGKLQRQGIYTEGNTFPSLAFQGNVIFSSVFA
jgi:Uma2 family endonuclease